LIGQALGRVSSYAAPISDQKYDGRRAIGEYAGGGLPSQAVSEMELYFLHYKFYVKVPYFTSPPPVSGKLLNFIYQPFSYTSTMDNYSSTSNLAMRHAVVVIVAAIPALS